MFNKEKRYDKKLNRSIKKELNKIPKTTLETIPYLAAFEDGIFEPDEEYTSDYEIGISLNFASIMEE